MKSWALYGITKKLTEPFKKLKENGKKIDKIFSKSLNIYPIDVGNNGDLNFEMAALATPQYNIHRFGIFLQIHQDTQMFCSFWENVPKG